MLALVPVSSSSRSFALPGSEAPNSVIAAMAAKTVLILLFFR